MRITFTASNPGIHKGRTNSIKEIQGPPKPLAFCLFLLFFLAVCFFNSSCVPILHNDMAVKCELLRFDTA